MCQGTFDSEALMVQYISNRVYDRSQNAAVYECSLRSFVAFFILGHILSEMAESARSLLGVIMDTKIDGVGKKYWRKIAWYTKLSGFLGDLIRDRFNCLK